MKKLIPFLLAILLLSGCSPAAVERPNTPVPPTATVAPTSTATPTSVPPTATLEVTRCTLDSRGNLLLPGGREIGRNFEGWTVNNEYYVGGYSKDGLVFCFLEQGFTGPIVEFYRQTNVFADGVPDQILDTIGRDGLFEVFPSPNEKEYIFLKAVEEPRVIDEYNVWIWNDEKQEANLLLKPEDEFWRTCATFVPPANIQWLNEDLIFIECYFDAQLFIDLEKGEYEHRNRCDALTFARDWFSPNGQLHLSAMQKLANYDADIFPLTITDSSNLLNFHWNCEESGSFEQFSTKLEENTEPFFNNAKEIPFSFTHYQLLSRNKNVYWAADSQYLYLIDMAPESDTYRDILKYHVDTGGIDILVKFDSLKHYAPDINDEWYHYEISPSEEYVLIRTDWYNSVILPIADLQ